MIVVDASVLATALLDDGTTGEKVRTRLRREKLLAAPDIIYLEVLSVMRRQIIAGRVDTRRASLALEDLHTVPVRVAPHRSLLPRVWALRENLTSYDASYVALAERLGVVLLTGDVRLSRAPGTQCTFETLED